MCSVRVHNALPVYTCSTGNVNMRARVRATSHFVYMLCVPTGAHGHVLPRRRRRRVYGGGGACGGANRVGKEELRGHREGFDTRRDAVFARTQHDHQNLPRAVHQALPQQQSMFNLCLCMYYTDLRCCCYCNVVGMAQLSPIFINNRHS